LTDFMRKFSYRLYGHRLRVTRLVLGITEQEAADACGVMLKTYQGYEEGTPQRGYRVPNAFYVKHGVSLNWLLRGEADHIGNHLAKGAKGKVAILPVVGPRRRKAAKRYFGSIEPAPAA
jgi:DNA-binding XRE family transcriptional regulator